MAQPGTMLAAVVRAPGGPDALRLERRPIPEPGLGDVLVRIKAFGIGDADVLARRGDGPATTFPRILGGDAVGVVAAAPGGEFREGETVATAMGGMGRSFDGSYAEFACLPARQLLPIATTLSWAILGAAPETLHTAWGSLFRCLEVKAGERLLIRGGATPVGLVAVGMASALGVTVCATVADGSRGDLVRRQGARHVIVDAGAIASHILEVFPRGMDKVLELVGVSTLEDSLRCVRKRGMLCVAGMLGARRSLDHFDPLAAIPDCVRFTSFDAAAEDFVLTPLEALLARVSAGTLRVAPECVFPFEEIAQAHRAAEEGAVAGKIVVTLE